MSNISSIYPERIKLEADEGILREAEPLCLLSKPNGDLRVQRAVLGFARDSETVTSDSISMAMQLQHRAIYNNRRKTDALAAFVEQAASGAYLRLRYVFESAFEKPVLTISYGQNVSNSATASDLEEQLKLWVNFIWPGTRLSEQEPELNELIRQPIVPQVYDHWASSAVSVVTGPEKRDRADGALLEQAPWRQLNIEDALSIAARHAPSEFSISLTPFSASARYMRNVRDLLQKSSAKGEKSKKDGDRNQFLRNLECGKAVRIGIEFGTESPTNPVVSELISYSLFGCASDPNGFSHEQTDLRCLWPLGSALSELIHDRPAVQKPQTDIFIAKETPGAALLGKSEDNGSELVLAEGDREGHVYLIGATRSGKSTLISNCAVADIKSGEGVILIDPHGDVAEVVVDCVPESRRNDVIWCDFSQPETILGINILETTGLNPAFERSIIANNLVYLIKSVLYEGVEAFGPCWDSYFRNALLLLMSGGQGWTDLSDLERVFHDAQFRMQLLLGCDDDKVKEFWQETATNVNDSHDWSLANMAPYITVKMAQLTGNPIVRKFIAAKGERLDLRSAMNQGKIVIIKLNKGVIGELDTRLIATILCMRIMQAGMSRSTLAPSLRRTCRLYIDEYQNVIGSALTTLLSESAKYGIAATIANQSLGQVTGRTRGEDSGEAALANCSSLVVFRTGAIDALKLGPWMAPEIDWREMTRLPNYHAIARVLVNGRPLPPQIIKTPPPPQIGG